MEGFVDNCFYALQLDPAKDEISRLKCAQLFYELMLGHKYGDDWNDKEFNTIYDLFQDDETDDKSDGGLDSKEFTRLIKRIAEVWILYQEKYSQSWCVRAMHKNFPGCIIIKSSFKKGKSLKYNILQNNYIISPL